MPMIQLIRRDSKVIELEADSITMGIDRAYIAYPLPVVNTRVALDMNQTNLSIEISGILTDDDEATGGAGAAMTIDTSVHGGQILQSTWYESFASWSAVKTELNGVRIKFQSIGQINAGLGEDITLQLKNSSGSSTVATNSIIVIDISSTTSTDTLSNTIATAISNASVKVNTATTTCSSLFTFSQSSGQFRTLSEDAQGGSNFDGELITIKNKVKGENGNHIVTVSQDDIGRRWEDKFSVSNMTGGAASQKLTMDDKVQDFLNLANMSAGGALVSPNAVAGSVVNIPDSVSSFDASSLLRIDEMETVKKYIVGIRIPYESLASSTTGNRELRQYLIPSGIGTNFSSSSNDKIYDPTTTVNNKITRPNPFLEQGVAIPCILKSFKPSFNAGDGYWAYTMSITPVEQLVGI